ncbi:hypothetical protein VNI00_018361 [Paramarasmius palmivorus]|uniref:CCHC-type domain-containing protein n=1 Tax=Paramarasmius palmivorus TaxID=297713 RepID=A0AAW0B0S0_9AGAR
MDRLEYEVMQTAISICTSKVGALYGQLPRVSFNDVKAEEVDEDYGRHALTPAPAILKRESIKTEPRDDEWGLKISSSVDKHSVDIAEIKEMTRTLSNAVQESIKRQERVDIEHKALWNLVTAGNQLATACAPTYSQARPLTPSSSTMGMASKTGTAMVGQPLRRECFMCKKPDHFINDCPAQAKFRELKWLKEGPEGGHLVIYLFNIDEVPTQEFEDLVIDSEEEEDDRAVKIAQAWALIAEEKARRSTRQAASLGTGGKAKKASIPLPDLEELLNETEPTRPKPGPSSQRMEVHIPSLSSLEKNKYKESLARLLDSLSRKPTVTIEELDSGDDESGPDLSKVVTSRPFDKVQSVARPPIPQNHVLEKSGITATRQISADMSTSDLLRKGGAARKEPSTLDKQPLPKKMTLEGTDKDIAEQFFRNPISISLDDVASISPAVRKILLRKLRHQGVRKKRASAYLAELAVECGEAIPEESQEILTGDVYVVDVDDLPIEDVYEVLDEPRGSLSKGTIIHKDPVEMYQQDLS